MRSGSVVYVAQLAAAGPASANIEEGTMSLFYKIAFWLGFTPWEQAATHPPAAEKISMLFDREESGRQPP